MENITYWTKLREWSFKMAAVFAELAIAIPGIIIAFENNLENRWLVLGLTSIFITLSVAYAAVRDRHSKKLVTPYLVAQTILTIALLSLNPFMTFYVIWFYVLCIEAIMALSRRAGLGWLLAFVALTIVLLVALLPLTEALVSLPIFLGGFFFFATFANATYQANEARKESLRLLEELQTAHRQLQEYAIKAEELAVAEERNRLSREMHDTVGHRLTVASVQLEGIQKIIGRDTEKAASMAGVVREQIREALQELRQSVATLREPLESDLPLEVSIPRLVKRFEAATEMPIHLMLPPGMPDLTTGQRLALYRTTQEALTNIQKHAGASQVWLQIESDGNQIVLRVSDNGAGPLEVGKDSGYGLRGMRERAAQLNGVFLFEARRGGGAQLSMTLPITH